MDACSCRDKIPHVNLKGCGLPAGIFYRVSSNLPVGGRARLHFANISPTAFHSCRLRAQGSEQPGSGHAREALWEGVAAAAGSAVAGGGLF